MVSLCYCSSGIKIIKAPCQSVGLINVDLLYLLLNMTQTPRRCSMSKEIHDLHVNMTNSVLEFPHFLRV